MTEQPITSPVVAANRYAGLRLLGLLLASLVAWSKTGIVWPSFQGLEQFWLLPNWQLAGAFLIGWILAFVGLQLDDTKSYTWYQSQPITRSIFFVVALFILGSFVITSAGSGIGTGLILGLWTALTIEVLGLQQDPAAFNDRFLHDIKPEKREKFAQTWQYKWGSVMLVGLVFLVGLTLLF